MGRLRRHMPAGKTVVKFLVNWFLWFAVFRLLIGVAHDFHLAFPWWQLLLTGFGLGILWAGLEYWLDPPAQRPAELSDHDLALAVRAICGEYVRRFPQAMEE